MTCTYSQFIYFTFREEYLAKIEKRIKDYKIEILNEPRPGKKLLVLDIDYTLFGKWNPVDVIGGYSSLKVK
jgi:ubiquitin-like domain-containing CTD phosphatase 1